jgi:peptide/nickel transport system permease protein
VSAAGRPRVARPRIHVPRLRFTRYMAGRVALAVFTTVILLAFLGPLLAPHSPAEQVGPPFAAPSGAFPLGTDYLGEDVLSRLLSGGRTVILIGGVATLLAYLVGGTVGLAAGYRGGVADSVLMRAMDLLLAFPPLLFLLLLATGFGNSIPALVVGIATVHVPSIARIIRTAALEVAVRGYVEAAVARGDGARVILRREILPNIWGTIAADAGSRFTVSILLVAAVNFLGLGQAPPAADWSLMISENRGGITINAWAVIAPALIIGVLTVSLNVLADAIARTRGTSVDVEAMRR